MSDTPIIVSKYASDQFSVHSRPPRWHNVVAIVLGIVAFGAYVSLNMWLFTLGKVQQNADNHTDVPFSTQTGTGATVLGESRERPAQPTPTRLPLPNASSSFRPVLNPSQTISSSSSGLYACDSTGMCNLYKNPASAGCPVTFSDPRCLSQCSNSKNQCKE